MARQKIKLEFVSRRLLVTVIRSDHDKLAHHSHICNYWSIHLFAALLESMGDKLGNSGEHFHNGPMHQALVVTLGGIECVEMPGSEPRQLELGS